MSHGVYVLGGKCPGGTCLGGYVLEPFDIVPDSLICKLHIEIQSLFKPESVIESVNGGLF